MTFPNHILIPEVERLVNEGICVTMRVKGNSMLPFIRGGRDSVELQKAKLLRPKSIVLARLADGSYVVHRIIKLTGDDVELMGDGNLRGREHCKQTDVVAEVTQILRKGKTVSCSCRSERVKAGIWIKLLSVRRYLLAIYKRLD